MFIDYDTFYQRAVTLRQRLDAICARAGRKPAEVTILPVTKTHPAAAAEYAVRFGLTSVGENRVQEAVEKKAQTITPVRWELIGHLQSNKAKLAAMHFDRIQSVDSEKLLHALDRAAAALGKKLPVLLQINAGQDPAKFGVEPEDASRLLEAALNQSHLQVDGLMTIAPISENAAIAERTFMNLRDIRDDLVARFQIALPELSMGMSSDLETAVTAGSTQIRIGSLLYGPR